MKFDNISTIENLQKGDHQVFNDLFECYYHPMCAFISPMFKEQDIVEDIVTDCFVKLWENRKSLKINRSIQNYLLTTAKNSAISYIRKNKMQYVDIDEISKILFEEEPHVVSEAEVYNKLFEAVNKLPGQRRKILKMATFEGKSYGEISNELNISVNTVKTQIARSYRFLKSELDSAYRAILELLFIHIIITNS